MNSRYRALAVLAALAVATLYMGGTSAPRAQTICPDTLQLCRTEGGVILCGNCGVPDSDHVDSLRLRRLVTMIPEQKPASGIAARLDAPLASGAMEGATLDAIVMSDGGPLAEMRMLRQQIQNQWRWIVSTGAPGRIPATKATFKVLSGGKTVASVSSTTGTAELPEFPASVVVTTTKSATTVTWGFPEAVGVRIGAALQKLGAPQHGNALAITVAKGSPSGITRFDLNRRGTGAINLTDVKATPLASATVPAPAPSGR